MALTPGVIDAEAERVFTEGGCGSLAAALHDATGWPVVGVFKANEVLARDGSGYREGATRVVRARPDGMPDTDERAMHWAVLRPDGKLVDILGARSTIAVIRHHDGEVGESALVLGHRDWALSEGRSFVTLAVARRFVKAVLARAGGR